jgi:guanylate kinase
MLVLIGASASGKTEITKILIKKYGFKKMITYTTRPMRVGEINGVDYHFITKEEFIAKANNHEFLETTLYNDNYYGTAFKDASFDKVLIVDPFGANKIVEKMPNDVTLFLLEAPQEVRAQRMLARGDKPEDIKKRLDGDNLYFDVKNLTRIDHIIDTNGYSLETLAEMICNLYKGISHD